MWLEKINDKKFKYTERYTDPLTEKREKCPLLYLAIHAKLGIKLTYF